MNIDNGLSGINLWKLKRGAEYVLGYWEPGIFNTGAFNSVAIVV
jgi:hypothetical protein